LFSSINGDLGYAGDAPSRKQVRAGAQNLANPLNFVDFPYV